MVYDRFVVEMKGNLPFRVPWWKALICRADIAIYRYGRFPISILLPVFPPRANAATFLWWESHICVETWQTSFYRRSLPCVLECFLSDLNIPPRFMRKIMRSLSSSVNSSSRAYRISDSTAFKIFIKLHLSIRWVSTRLKLKRSYSRRAI